MTSAFWFGTVIVTSTHAAVPVIGRKNTADVDAAGAGSVGITHDGKQLSLHSLRRSDASLLIANGLNVVFISRQLGDANPSITLSTYAHLYARADHRTRAPTRAT